METLKGITILVVDDEDILRESLREDLEYFGAIVIEAESAQAAFEKALATNIEVIISDLRMPHGDGMSLLRALRINIPNPPLFFLFTGFSELSQDEVKELGAVNILSKPYNLDQMISSISSALLDFDRRTRNI